MTKKCFKCGETKDLSEFYRHDAMEDGHLGKCKDCTRKDSLQHRKDNLESVREYDRNRKNKAERTEKTKARLARIKEQDPGKYRMQVIEAKERYRKRNREKAIAHERIFYAVSTGKLKNPCVCERCNTKCVTEAHHYDYSKPLEVTWLCDYCHKEVHKEMRRKKRTLPA
jgi:hypothetical protein